MKIKRYLISVIYLILVFSLVPCHSKILSDSFNIKFNQKIKILNDSMPQLLIAQIKDKGKTGNKAGDDGGIRGVIDKAKDKIEEETGLEISGFFDFTIANYSINPNIFNIGDFELDVEHNTEYFQVAGAIVLNEAGAELAVAFIDFHPTGGSISPRGRLFEEEGFHFQVGKFDIPFGNDWQYYASADRIAVSAPLSTEHVIERGFNDIGFRILVSQIYFNTTLYIVRGVGRGHAIGGRFGFTPFNNPYTLQERSVPKFELGFSYMHDMDRGWKTEERSYGLDMEGNIGWVLLRSEFYLRDIKQRIDTETPVIVNRAVHDGFQITFGLNMEEVMPMATIIFVRFDNYRLRNNKNSFSSILAVSGDLTSRIASGFNINLKEVLIIKFEYAWYLYTFKDYRENVEGYSNESFYVQFVITF